MDLIKAKRIDKKPPPVSEARPSNVINLMDARRQNACGGGNGGGQSSARKSNGRKRASPKCKVRR